MEATLYRPMLVLAFAMQTAALLSCGPSQPPPTREVLHLSGGPYQRGHQHGVALKSKIRSFYTTLLAASILPNLTREQPDLAAVFPEYAKERYAGGRFGYELLLDSARSLEKSIPKAHQEEMRGIADGAEVPYEQVLVLNTFLDSLMAVRAVALTARLSGAPQLQEVVVLGGLENDGADNDGDGEVDEAEEGNFPYRPLPHAALVELPASAAFRLTLSDPDEVDPALVRLTVAGILYQPGDPELVSVARPGALEVTLTPRAPLPRGAFELVVQAGDRSLVSVPAPAHARFMRDERLSFTTRGADLPPKAVPNRGPQSDRDHPPALAFAGGGVLGHHFALLDGNSAHKHTAVFIHHPDKGEPFAVVGWAGIIWGMSGMNGLGLAGSCASSDTLDNSVVKGLLAQISDLSTARLLPSGQPIGIFQRLVLERSATVAEAAARAKSTDHAYGWNCLYADAAGGMKAVEVDSDFSGDGRGFDFGPGELEGEVPGTLRIASHFRKNTADMPQLNVAGQRLTPQRGFSSFYFRSLNALAALGDRLGEGGGALDAERAVAILRTPELVDFTDSMTAAVFEPSARRFRVAIGQVPATDGEFEQLSLEDAQ